MIGELLEQKLANACIRYHVPGASLAVYECGELHSAATGIANIETGAPVTDRTVMHIGSITKIFTTVLVMQLADEGVLDLGDPVVRHLPDLTLGDPAARDRISVAMLLNHLSGINCAAQPDAGHDRETLAGAVARLESAGQLHPPGAEFSYCNAGMLLAGHLVAEKTGRDWYDLLRERIFDPLGLIDAATLPEEAILHNCSVGHFYDVANKVNRRTSRAFLPLGFGPAGTSTMMSASALVEFSTLFLRDGVAENGLRLLSSRSVAMMTEPSVHNRDKGYTTDLDMGLGWMLADRILTHSGAAPGAMAALYVDRDRDRAIAILTNGTGGASLIDEMIEPWLAEATVQHRFLARVHEPDPRPAIDPARYTGVYADAIMRFRITADEAGLLISQEAAWSYYDNVSTEPTPPTRLLALGGDRFAWRGGAEDVWYECAFRGEDDGKPRYFAFSLRLFPRHYQ